MDRPGYLNGFSGMQPRLRTSPLLKKTFSGLGSFGKGVMAPPPAPPGIPPGAQPPQYLEGKWNCAGTAPPSEADGYYHCCPETGWTKTSYENTKPCGENYGQIRCGPLPPGASTADAVCCENLKEWVPRSEAGGDPCAQAAVIRAQQTGQAVPGAAETILAEDIYIDEEPVVNPALLLVGGLAMGVLFVVTIIFKIMR